MLSLEEEIKVSINQAVLQWDVMSNILMLIKRRPPHLHDFIENIYRRETVMITKLYIVVHILYDHHLYESIL